MDSQTIPEWRRHLREWVDRKHGGRKLPAARELGITVVTLRKLLGAEPPPVPQMRTIRRIARATGVPASDLLNPFGSAAEMMKFVRRTDYMWSRELPDGRSWKEVSKEVLDDLPSEANKALKGFLDWAGRRGIDETSIVDCVYNLILWPLRPGSWVMERYWSNRQLGVRDVVRIVYHGVQISKALLAPSPPERSRKRTKSAGAAQS